MDESIKELVEAVNNLNSFSWSDFISLFSLIAAWITIAFLIKDKIDNKRPYLQITFELIRENLACIVIRNVGNVQSIIPNFNNVITEAKSIGTYGAILNVAVYLKYIEKCDDNEIISIIPIDHDVEDFFYEILIEAEKNIIKNKYDICLIGINPTYPSTQYGYILSNNGIVTKFKEKPNEEDAIKLIKSNALWNSGIVVFRLKKILKIIEKHFKITTYDSFLKKIIKLPCVSFDKEVLEKEKNIGIIRTNLYWNDLGIWENLAQKISTPDKYNTNIINFENKKIVNKGIKNAIIVNSNNGIILISKKTNIKGG